ncbi:ADP-ribosylation factor-like protein 6-interacting protein 4 [Odontomachus brunneus]|uniref:ADP-ribosylation factor-like protein 6-interacting protein 4 n=1 Tax=Odontomachus brunneus TaxID=486640 RepID=UPI0013F1D18B|nr:ADP-ribosylation factor-like protein 6-interacting protein 4 [Odontomachus brunneus]XP_032681049.1 ADP-ribosylation factor-like protein 6-interacting protein 4 [Odontomachus brunneus]
MQHEPRYPALGAREPRQGDYDDDGVAQQVLSPVGCRSEDSVVRDTRNAVARNAVESCRRRRRRRAHPEVLARTWHSGGSNDRSSGSSSSSSSSSNSSSSSSSGSESNSGRNGSNSGASDKRKRGQQTGERHEVVVQEVQVARQKEKAEALVDYERGERAIAPLPPLPLAPLPLLLSPRQLLETASAPSIVVAVAAAATTAATAVAAELSGRGTLVQGNF